MFEQVGYLSPDDQQAEAGIEIVDRLKDGTLNRAKIRKELKGAEGWTAQVVDGRRRAGKRSISSAFEQDAAEEAAWGRSQAAVDAPENLLKEHRDRQAVEEQKVTRRSRTPSARQCRI